MKTMTELPVAMFKDQILESVSINRVTIVVAETGAGKSTQVPQYLLGAGYNVIVTQPRRIAARKISERASFEFGCELGETIGYRTAFEGADGHTTECLYVTDGLALMREFRGHGHHNVIVLDEIHEWNLNMELLVGLIKRKIDEGLDIKVVIMSATMDSDALSKYFDGAPVINIPGRLHKIKVDKPQGIDNAENAEYYLRRKHSIMVFEPGKEEIQRTIDSLNWLRANRGLNAKILPLHADLNPEEQALCFKEYKQPLAIVSTNVGQSSLTPPVKVVIDGGMEKSIEFVSGVEMLCLESISLACREQRKGRAGRTEPGIYVDRCERTNRPKYRKPEIFRLNLDGLVLKILDSGYGVEDFEFFHQPPARNIEIAKSSLQTLGCVDENGKVTSIGHQVAKMPVPVRLGRMIVEAISLGVVGDILNVVAILEQRGITLRHYEKTVVAPWRKLCEGEDSSDIIAQLNVWSAAEKMKKEQFEENGIYEKAFLQAKEKVRHLRQMLGEVVENFEVNGDRGKILQAVRTGMIDLVYKRRGDYWVGEDREDRFLSRDSIVCGRRSIFGIPFDLEVQNRDGDGTRIIRTIGMATEIG